MLDHKAAQDPSDVIAMWLREQQMYIQAAFLRTAKQKRSRDMAIPACRFQGKDVVSNEAPTGPNADFQSLRRAVHRNENASVSALSCRCNDLIHGRKIPPTGYDYGILGDRSGQNAGNKIRSNQLNPPHGVTFLPRDPSRSFPSNSKSRSSSLSIK